MLSRLNRIKIQLHRKVNEGVKRLAMLGATAEGGSTVDTALECDDGFLWFLQGVANETQSTQGEQNIDAVGNTRALIAAAVRTTGSRRAGGG